MDLYFDPDFDPNSPTLSKDESHHCLRVMRHTLGDPIGVMNGKGTIWSGTIVDTTSSLCTLTISDTHNESPRTGKVAIAVSIPKSNDRVEWIIEKATELGVDEIFPISSEHSERKKVNPDRLRKKAISAIKQSKNPFLPTIHPLQNFHQLIDGSLDWDHKLIANQGGDDRIQMKTTSNRIIAIGPEGGFSESEINLALSNNWMEVSLGNHILRTETAAIIGVNFLHTSIL